MLLKKLCKGWGRWVLIVDILIGRILWVEAEYVGIHVVCCCCIASHLGVVELENKGPRLRSVLLSCCRIVRQTHVHILLAWALQKGLIVVWPFSFFGDSVVFILQRFTLLKAPMTCFKWAFYSLFLMLYVKMHPPFLWLFATSFKLAL